MESKYVKNKIELARIKSLKKQGQPTNLEIQGSGKLNRDGVPEIPPDQKSVDRWPVLDLGIRPDVNTKNWQLEVFGLCQKPQKFNFQEFKKLPISKDTSDFHCVTGWSKLGIQWQGVLFSDLAKFCEINPEAKYISISAYDGYTTNLSLTEAMKYDVMIVFEADGKPLEDEHGGPVRMITPQLWAWKGAKWIKSIEFLKEDRRGFWEVRGYSNSAIPWLNDRYTADEQSD